MSDLINRITDFFSGIKVPKITIANISDEFTTTLWGELSSSSSGVYSVSFPKEFVAPPSVIALANMRQGQLSKKAFVPPSISKISEVKAPAFPSVRQLVPASISESKVDYLSSEEVTISEEPKGVPFNEIFNNIRNSLNNIIAAAFTGESSIEKQVNQAFASINKQLTDSMQEIGSSIDGVTSKIGGALVERINQVVAETNNGLQEASMQATEALNKSVDRLYELLNLSEGMKFTPLGLQEVTTTGFKLYVPKDSKVSWIAIGKTKLW